MDQVCWDLGQLQKGAWEPLPYTNKIEEEFKKSLKRNEKKIKMKLEQSIVAFMNREEAIISAWTSLLSKFREIELENNFPEFNDGLLYHQ